MEFSTVRLLSRHVLRSFSPARWLCGRRSFLSDAYRCQDIWDARTSLPAFKDLNIDKFYMVIDKNFQTQGKALPIDIDIFAMCATTEQQLEDLQDVIHRLRRTRLTVATLPSTGHAVVRAFLAASPERRHRLLELLDDRMNYGIFLDVATANMLMDTFLKEGNNRDAAKIATHLMLQEDWDDPINKALALYSCNAYVESPVPEPWRPPDPVEDEDAETEYVRVAYLRNEWHDGHFDIREAHELVGKTLAWIGSSVDSAGGRSCQLLGWAMYRQWQQLRQCCDTLRDGDGVCQDVIFRVTQLVADAGDQCPDSAVLSDLISHLPTTPDSLAASLRAGVEAAVAAHEATHVVELRRLYADWERRRLDELQLQRQAVDRQQRMQALDDKRQYLREQQRLLWFFDNEEQLKAEGERQWDRPPRPKPLFVQKVLRRKRPTQDDYVPPVCVSRITNETCVLSAKV